MHKKQRRYNDQRKSVAFVRTSRCILAHVMNEKGVAPKTASELLETLPPTFNEWAPEASTSVLQEVSS